MKISKLPNTIDATVDLPSSKSISNRLLILRAVSDNALEINNLSFANDTQLLRKALNNLSPGQVQTFDLDNAGTAFRFLTAYLSTYPSSFILTGSQRMQQRPIKPLVDALITIGAKIAYIHKEGYPPLFIQGSDLAGGYVEIDCSQSSQFATALMLIAPKIPGGLDIRIVNPKSYAYVLMTADLLQQIGVPVKQIDTYRFFVPNYRIESQTITVEADWSSATFWYAILNLAHSGQILLKNLMDSKLQGDRYVAEIYQHLGIVTEFNSDGVLIRKVAKPFVKKLVLNLKDYPDLAVPLIVNLVLLNIQFEISGLEHLKYKESDRISALNQELSKIGINLQINDQGVLTWKGNLRLDSNVVFDSHNDHRLAMALSQVAMFTDIEITNEKCVEKSYPDFWQNFLSLYT